MYFVQLRIAPQNPKTPQNLVKNINVRLEQQSLAEPAVCLSKLVGGLAESVHALTKPVVALTELESDADELWRTGGW